MSRATRSCLNQTGPGCVLTFYFWPLLGPTPGRPALFFRFWIGTMIAYVHLKLGRSWAPAPPLHFFFTGPIFIFKNAAESKQQKETSDRWRLKSSVTVVRSWFLPSQQASITRGQYRRLQMCSTPVRHFLPVRDGLCPDGDMFFDGLPWKDFELHDLLGRSPTLMGKT